MGFLSKLWKGVKKVAGFVASVAAPVIAAPLASAIGLSGTIGTALVGAGIGAAGAALSGNDPLMGAAIGGIGGFAAGGGLRGFGIGGQGPQAAAAQGTGAGAISSSAVRPVARSAAAAAPAAATSSASGGFLGNLFGGAGGGTGGILGGLANQVLSNPSGLARLAMTVFGRPPQDLTDIEQQRLAELRQLAATDRDLFERRVEEAQQFFRTADQQAPNLPEAYGEARIGLERRLSEQARGMDRGSANALERRAALAGARAGATAAAAEEARAFDTQTQLRQAGVQTLPTNAPEGYAGLALPIYEDLQQRRYSYNNDLASSFGNLFGEREDLEDRDSLGSSLTATIG